MSDINKKDFESPEIQDPKFNGDKVNVLKEDEYNPLGKNIKWNEVVSKGGYGQGIAGLKPAIPGWENTTVGMPGNVKNRLAQQNGIQSFEPEAVASREPFRLGRFIVKWLKYPPFFHPLAVAYLRYLFEDCVKSVSGITDNNIDPITVPNGTTRQEYTYMGIYKENNREVTLRVPETAGSPVRKLIDYWYSGISDRKSGVCHMYGKELRAVQPNKSGSLIYIVLGPTCRPEDIEFACMWHEVVPTSGERISMYNSELGEVGGNVEADVTFSGIFDRGPHIDLLARVIVEAYNLYSDGFWKATLPNYLNKIRDGLVNNDVNLINRFRADYETRIGEINANLNEDKYGVTKSTNIDLNYKPKSSGGIDTAGGTRPIV